MAAPSAVVQVTYDCTRPETHLVRVTQRIPASDAPHRTLWMPAWVPGSYKIRDFGRHVQDLWATVGGRPAKVSQPTKDSWVVEGSAGKAVTVTFDVYCRELTVDTSHVTAEHAHVFPPTCTLYDADTRTLPHQVSVVAPKGWRVWSGLEASLSSGHEPGLLGTARDYDHLIDCPIEAGPPSLYHVERFSVRNVPHRIVAWQPPPGVDWKRITRDVKAIVTQAAKVFGGLPYEHYSFIGHVALEYGGGLEHRNSTVLGIDPQHMTVEDKIQTRFLPLVAHEFFHTWNVKRILPRSFQPYDLQRETYTGLLWLFEGFTSYYEMPILHRAGVVTAESWGKMAAEDLEAYEKALGRRRTPVAQASRLSWTLLYQPHEHNVNRNVSYYTKGMWIGLCLDAQLRKRGVAGGLDVVMRHAWNRHGATGEGIPEGGFPDLVLEATGVDLRRTLRAWIEGTEDPPIDASLKLLGWDVKREWKDPKKRNGLGITFKAGSSAIERIPEDAPAAKVLQPDDELVAAAGYKWKAERFADHAAALRPGQTVDLAFFREGRLHSAAVPVIELPKDKVTIAPAKKDAAAARRRKAWGGEPKPTPKDDKGPGAVPPRGRHNRF